MFILAASNFHSNHQETNTMNKLNLVIIVLLSVVLSVNQSSAKTIVTRHSHQQTGTDVVSKIGDDSNYAEFATLAKTANLQATLKALVSYTVFAPDNNAFRQLPFSTMDSLSKNPDALAAMLKAYIVKGKVTKAQIIAAVTAGKGKMKFTNILGQPLKLSVATGNKLILTDAKGNSAQIVSLDMMGTGSVLHGINAVMLAAK